MSETYLGWSWAGLKTPGHLSVQDPATPSPRQGAGMSV